MRRFKPVIKPENSNVILPLRGTKTSAGYDFYTPVDLEIRPQDKVFFWTDVKAEMPESEFLALFVRSSSGIKLDLMLANTVPIVDSDYAGNDKNDGNIGICVRNLKPSIELKGHEDYLLTDYYYERPVKVEVPIINDLTEENTVRIKAGDRVAQGIFIEYKSSENCNTETERAGGLGHTSKETSNE